MKIFKYSEFLFESNISMEIQLPEDIIEISNAFIKAGKDIFVVGGSIRDVIQGKKPKDYDLVTNALPDESKKILKGFNVSDEQGKNFGVLRIFTKDEPKGYELASYRKDISLGRDTKGDDQKVELGTHITMKDDAMRRDLTINALYYDIKSKQIIDLVGGVKDIESNIIRAVGDPEQRFIEDRLRILRIFRFSSRMGGKIDIETSEAIKSDNRLNGISVKDDVSPERIWEEMQKAFEQVKDYKEYLEYFNEYDMWDQIFPGSIVNKEIKECSELSSYIANIFRNENISKIENRMVLKYKIGRDFASKVTFLIKLLGLSNENAPDLFKDKIRCHCELSLINDWIDLNKLTDEIYRKFLKYKPSVSSEDLMKKGFSGRALGLEIKRLEIENFKLLK